MLEIENKLPRFTDLRGMAKDVEGESEYERFGIFVQKAAFVQSCLTDIVQAKSCCDALENLRKSKRKTGTIEKTSTENALLSSGVMLYARATSTGGSVGERGSSQIKKSLNEDQRLDHEALIEIRNRAFAHVYTDQSISNEVWHEDKIFLVETNAGWKPASFKRTSQFHKLTFERLKRQLPIADSILITRFHSHINQLTKILTESPLPLSVFENNLFDPVKLFGSKEQVRKALDGMPVGRATGIT